MVDSFLTNFERSDKWFNLSCVFACFDDSHKALTLMVNTIRVSNFSSWTFRTSFTSFISESKTNSGCLYNYFKKYRVFGSSLDWKLQILQFPMFLLSSIVFLHSHLPKIHNVLSWWWILKYIEAILLDHIKQTLPASHLYEILKHPIPGIYIFHRSRKLSEFIRCCSLEFNFCSFSHTHNDCTWWRYSFGCPEYYQLEMVFH